jgi:hypothetical protein
MSAKKQKKRAKPLRPRLLVIDPLLRPLFRFTHRRRALLSAAAEAKAKAKADAKAAKAAAAAAVTEDEEPADDAEADD